MKFLDSINRRYGPNDARQEGRRTLVHTADDIRRNITRAISDGGPCFLELAADIYLDAPITIPNTVTAFSLNGGSRFRIVATADLSVVINVGTAHISRHSISLADLVVDAGDYTIASLIGTVDGGYTVIRAIIANVKFDSLVTNFFTQNTYCTFSNSDFSGIIFNGSGLSELIGNSASVEYSAFRDIKGTFKITTNTGGGNFNVYENISCTGNIAATGTGQSTFINCSSYGYLTTVSLPYRAINLDASQSFQNQIPSELVITSSAADGGLVFQEASTDRWALGYDQSATAFKVSASGTLGTTDRLTIDSGGLVTAVGDFAVGGSVASALTPKVNDGYDLGSSALRWQDGYLVNLNVSGLTVLGDASGDTLTIAGTAVSIPNSLNFDANTLYLDATNNRVGIGNAAPTVALDVTGAGAFSGALSSASLATTGNLSVDGNTTLGNASGDTLTVNGSTVACANGLNFDSNTLVIDSMNNRVGVNTSAPTYKLHVVGDGYVTTDLRVGDTFSVGLGSGGALSAQAQIQNTNSDTDFTNQAAPYSSSPGVLIQNLSQTTGAFGSLGFSVFKTGSGTAQIAGILGQSQAGTYSAELVFWRRSGSATTAESMRIDASGNVGIGTATPSGTLDIAGIEYVKTGTVNTTNGTVTTILTLATASNTGYSIEVDTVGRQTAGGTNQTNIYKSVYRVKNNGGVLSYTVTGLVADEEVAAWSQTGTTSGTNFLVQVTGAAATNISWSTIARVRPI